MPSVVRGSRRKRSKVEGILPDIHLPSEDDAAVHWAIRELEHQSPHGITLLGDVVSFDSISRFKKSLLTKASLPEEIRSGRRFFRWIDKVFPKAKKRLIQGNHENRLSSYLKTHAPELGELPELMFRDLLRIPKSWEVLDYGDAAKVQGILIQHGNKWGETTCKQNLLLGCSSVQGHSHRFRLLSHRCAGTDSILTACELGCLCSFKQGYARLTNWAHAMGWIQDGRLYTVVR